MGTVTNCVLTTTHLSGVSLIMVNFTIKSFLGSLFSPSVSPISTSTSNHDSLDMEDESSTHSEGETDIMDTNPVPVPVNSIAREQKHNIHQGFLSLSVTYIHTTMEEEEEFSATEIEETD